jgi:hypothetical protein
VILFRFHKKVEGHLCPRCAQKTFQEMTWITFFAGWWGIVSFFVTPVYLVLNLANYLGASEGPKGAANARTPAPEATAPLGWAISSLVVGVLSFFLGLILGKWSFVGYLAAVISAFPRCQVAHLPPPHSRISCRNRLCGLPLTFAVLFRSPCWWPRSLGGSARTPATTR